MNIMRFLGFLLTLLAAVGLTGCNSRPEAPALNIAKSGAPAMWKVQGSKPEQKGTVYLFGTIHILPDDVKWRTPAIEDAIRASDRLVIEVLGLDDTRQAAETFRKLAVSPGQPDILDRLGPSLRDDLEDAIDNSPVTERSLNRLETWAAALSLASAQTDRLGLSSGSGVERRLVTQFEALDKPVEALETIEQQLGYFDRLPEQQQRTMLTSVVEESDTAQQAFEELFNAWITGDVEALVTLTDDGILSDAKIREYILVRRNEDWASQLDSRLQQPGTSFVAVGAAHLVGPDAVQLLLEPLGYKIEKIQ